MVVITFCANGAACSVAVSFDPQPGNFDALLGVLGEKYDTAGTHEAPAWSGSEACGNDVTGNDFACVARGEGELRAVWNVRGGKVALTLRGGAGQLSLGVLYVNDALLAQTRAAAAAAQAAARSNL